MTPDESSQRAEIDALRAQIDAIDRDIVRLLAKRLESAVAIGRIKHEGDVALIDAVRELEVERRWRAHAVVTGVPGTLADAVLREIVAHSRRVQEPGLRIAFQGVPGAHSDRAARHLAVRDGMSRVEPLGYRSFEEAVSALVEGSADFALLPVENSICGRISSAWDAVAAHAVHAVAEIEIQIEHCLAGLPGADIAGITVVRSHPVALAQCGRLIDCLGAARAEEWLDTADAARAVAASGDPAIAAICHEDAALHHGLVVLRREVADADDNRTRFLLFARSTI